MLFGWGSAVNDLDLLALTDFLSFGMPWAFYEWLYLEVIKVSQRQAALFCFHSKITKRMLHRNLKYQLTNQAHMLCKLMVNDLGEWLLRLRLIKLSYQMYPFRQYLQRSS